MRFRERTRALSSLIAIAALVTTHPPVAVVTRDSAARYLSPALSAFEARRKTGLGYFVSEAELRKEDSRPLANVLRSHVPSLAIQDIFVKGQHLTIAASRRSGCGVDVFLDGIPLAPTPIAGALSPGRSGRPAAPPPAYVDLSQFNVTDLAGVEFHNVGDLPAEFEHTGNGCAALYLWTRER